jgi:hypothetical protein
MERDWPEEGLCAFGARTREWLRLEQGAPASFTTASQYPHPKPLYYGPSFVNPAVSSDGKRVSTLQVTVKVPFGVPIIFLAGL